MECEAAAKMVREWNGRKRGRKKRISVFRELNEAVECGTDVVQMENGFRHKIIISRLVGWKEQRLLH